LAAHSIDHYDLNIPHQSDGEYAVFTVTMLRSFEDPPVKSHSRILEINEVLCEVGFPFAFVPFEEHSKPLIDGRTTMRTYRVYRYYRGLSKYL
jgi:hypothetical protein